jgi:hypothetical protein
MQTIFILLAFISFLNNDYVKEKNERSLVLKPVFKGIYYDLEKDSVNDNACSRHIYYLFDVQIINHSDSIAEFIVFNCTVAENIVTDTKKLQAEVNSCTSNGTTIINLRPNQEFSFPVIFKAKTEIDFKIRIGFVIISPRKVSSDKIFSTVVESLENLKNVLWSDPINIGLNYENAFEIR